MANNSPCMGCQNRAVGCHSGCDNYAVYKAESEQNKKMMRKARDKDRDFRGALSSSTRRRMYSTH